MKCRALCAHRMKKYSSYYTGCEAVWGEMTLNGCFIYTEPIVRGDNTNKHRCWITISENMDPFKPHELGLCQNVNNEGKKDSNFKKYLGDADSEYMCLSLCKQAHEKSTVKNDISGCEYDQNVKTCHVYDKKEFKVVRGGYEGFDDTKRCWIKANYCLGDNDCNDDNICTIDTCDITTKECRHELSFSKCRTFGRPTSLAIRVEAVDAETTMSVDKIKSTIFGSSETAFSVQSQLKSCSYEQFEPVAYSGTTSSGQNIANGVAEVTLNVTVKGQQTGAIENAILKAANETFGNLKSEVDLLLLFLPPGTLTAGTTDWKVSLLD